MSSYSKFATVYDAIYAFKNYGAESEKVHALITEVKKSVGASLLDVACGTGGHLGFLRNWYSVEGLDLSENMLEVARQHYPGLTFHRADMRSFDLGRQFDAVICLFSAIGYMKTPRHLRKAIANMARHVAPGGVLIVEPWVTVENWKPGAIFALFVDKPGLKISRMDIPSTRNRISIINFHMMVGTPLGIEHFTERHEFGLFTVEEYVEAFTTAGLQVTHDPKGLIGRGLFIATRGGVSLTQPSIA